MEKKAAAKRGYLNEEFRLFHVRDKLEMEFEYHYHEFDKIVVFISGDVSYIMEGKAYFLEPWDILLVSHNKIHKPVIKTTEPYERFVLWMNASFLKDHSTEKHDLSACFKSAEERGFYLIRPQGDARLPIMRLLQSTEAALRSDEFAHDLLARTYYLQLLVELNKLALSDDTEANTKAYASDPKLAEIITYINDNLSVDLSLDALCEKFYVSKSYLMHKFKSMTGYPAHRYITQKRLIYAAQLIENGVPVIEAGNAAGFSDHSAFHRAFKRMFGTSPSKFTK